MHFVGLVNVATDAGGLGKLGPSNWPGWRTTLSGRSASTPIVFFAHIPLMDGVSGMGLGHRRQCQALSYVKRFGSVTVLNGHIHQMMQKVEGNVIVPHRDVDRIPAARSRHRAIAGSV